MRPASACISTRAQDGRRGEQVCSWSTNRESLGAARSPLLMLIGLAGVGPPAPGPAWAALLLGAADTLREWSGQPHWPLECERDEHTLAVLRALLGGEQLAQKQSQGRARPLSATLERAIADHAGKSTSTLIDASAMTGDRATREVEVLSLLVAGHTNREISKSLFIGPRTASKHVANILAKLGVGSRGEDGVFATRHALV